MPPTKNALLRYAAIDTCLQRTGRRWRFTDLHEAVSAAYNDYSGSGNGISVRTLREDLKNMRPGGATGYNAPVVADPEHGYYYEAVGYSIFNSPLTVDDLAVLQQALGTLRQLQGLGVSEELTGLVQRVELRLSQPSLETLRMICQFEQSHDYQGLQWLGKLYSAIQKQQTQWVKYQSFGAPEPQRVLVHPHLLKQYNGRWFLVAGRNKGQEGTAVYALDRIHSIETADEAYVPSEQEPATYFEHVIGVSILPEAQITDIQLRFAATRLPYVLTKPLHPSQQALRVGNETLIGLRLIPTRELVTLLLSFGGDVQVVKPLGLRQKLREEIQRALDKYAE